MAKPSVRTLAEVMLSRIDAGDSSAAVVERMAAYLVAERRTAEAPAIIRALDRLLLEKRHTLNLTVTSRTSVDTAQLNAIKELFLAQTQAKHVHIETKQDSSVIGGVLVESADHRLDLTVRRQLQRLKGVKR